MEHLPKWNEESSSGDKRSTLPLSTTQLVPSSELHFDDSSSAEESDLLVPHARIAKSALTASWQSLEESSDIETCGYYQGSQADVLQEMRAHPLPNHLETHKHGYQLSYELALDNMLSPFVSPTMNQSYGITYVHKCVYNCLLA